MNIWFPKKAKIIVALMIVMFLLTSQRLFAEVMSSGDYRIQSDSINFGGGLGSSDNYIIEDTYGEIATGESESDNYKLKAGYQQMQETYIAISEATDVTMSPSIGGISGGTSNGSTAVTVITDSAAGYELSIKASSTPALQGDDVSDTIADYTPASAGVPDFVFGGAGIAANESEFGFTVEGADIAQRFLDNGSNACNTGSTDTSDACWYGLSTSNVIVSDAASSNHPSGTETTVKYRTFVGSSRVQLAGTYTATTTLTAISL